MLSVVSNVVLEVAEVGEKLAVCNLVARPTLLQRVIDVLLLDVELAEVVSRLGSGETIEDGQMSEFGGLRVRGGCVCLVMHS